MDKIYMNLAMHLGLKIIRKIFSKKLSNSLIIHFQVEIFECLLMDRLEVVRLIQC